MLINARAAIACTITERMAFGPLLHIELLLQHFETCLEELQIEEQLGIQRTFIR
jgi:hypothetical protein